MVMNEPTKGLALCRGDVLVISIGKLQRLGACDLVLWEMHVHLIAVEVRIVGVAIRVVHAYSLLARQDSHAVAHDGRLMKRGLSIHENYVAIGEMTVLLLAAADAEVVVCRGQQLVSQRHSVLRGLVPQVDYLAVLVLDGRSAGPPIDAVDDSLLHLLEDVVGNGFRECEIPGEDRGNTTLVGLNVGIG